MSKDWNLLKKYDRYREDQQVRQGEEQENKNAIKDINGTDGEIANLMHKQLRRESRDAEIASLEAMIQSTYTTLQLEKAREYNENVARAYAKAVSKGGFSAIEAFEREMEKAREEEDFLVLVMMALS